MNNVDDIGDPVRTASTKYEIHPSILKMNEVITKMSFLFFINKIQSELKMLNAKKKRIKYIPAKENSNICCDIV